MFIPVIFVLPSPAPLCLVNNWVYSSGSPIFIGNDIVPFRKLFSCVKFFYTAFPHLKITSITKSKLLTKLMFFTVSLLKTLAYLIFFLTGWFHWYTNFKSFILTPIYHCCETKIYKYVFFILNVSVPLKSSIIPCKVLVKIQRKVLWVRYVKHAQGYVHRQRTNFHRMSQILFQWKNFRR